MRKTALLLTLLLLIISAASAATSGTSGSYVSVVSYEVDPGVFMQGDTGTIKVVVTNSGTESVDIRRATMITKDLQPLNDQAYATVGSIGPDVTKEFTFTLKAKGDGIYYPRFFLDFSSGGSMSYPVMIKVESSPLELSVLEKPDAFQKDVKSTVKLIVGNPRENTVNGVIVRPVSESADFTQTSVFIGELESNANSEVLFYVTPESDGEIKFIAEYRNGINRHETEIIIPLTLGEDKKSANPVVNNLEVTTTAEGFRISGDVTNAGLSNAKSVVVTTGSPAVPTEPNRLYVIGELEPDDFSGFDVDFTAESAETIPLLIQYKDEDGNDYAKTIDVKIRDSPQLSESPAKNNDEGLPVVAIILVIAVAAIAGGAIYCSWKKN
ncbi:MAG: hypothetical protein JXQ82_06200 [Methanomicrobiaceae archaeon]|nr:hypothetical protein [Methanomicrobiaceae archaeon]